MSKLLSKVIVTLTLGLMAYCVVKLIKTPMACSEPRLGGSCDYSN